GRCLRGHGERHVDERGKGRHNKDVLFHLGTVPRFGTFIKVLFPTRGGALYTVAMYIVYAVS
ncbi:hypothetical protein, partial [Alkalispirochaeta alkalica]|uniref:hypothetical protein n=1 Tax=Alkalispirochaeta alkalica TaxID=46356 RepID=UPI001C03631D